MDRKIQLKENQAYIEKEGLDELINFMDGIDFDSDVYDSVSGTLSIPMPPESSDLVRLHKIIRQRKCFTALEFGLGYSSIVIADALKKNKFDWDNLDDKPKLRNRFMFQLFSVDTSQQWIDILEQRFPEHLKDVITIRQSDVEIGTFNGQICHYYKNIPDVIPDFIYLDGPHPKEVQGSINGMSFNCDERTVMSGDLLLMEPVFLPGTFILVDGRTNNARFLQNNFKRTYKSNWDVEGDITTFELDEERLGKYNILGSDYLK